MASATAEVGEAPLPPADAVPLALALAVATGIAVALLSAVVAGSAAGGVAVDAASAGAARVARVWCTASRIADVATRSTTPPPASTATSHVCARSRRDDTLVASVPRRGPGCDVV